jgi:hypothetical protein
VSDGCWRREKEEKAGGTGEERKTEMQDESVGLDTINVRMEVVWRHGYCKVAASKHDLYIHVWNVYKSNRFNG